MLKIISSNRRPTQCHTKKTILFPFFVLKLNAEQRVKNNRFTVNKKMNKKQNRETKNLELKDNKEIKKQQSLLNGFKYLWILPTIYLMYKVQIHKDINIQMLVVDFPCSILYSQKQSATLDTLLLS